jgi:hypothetical protein
MASQVSLQLVESLLLEVATLALAEVLASFCPNSTACQRPFKIADFAANAGVHTELALVAFHGFGIPLERGLLLANALGQSNHRTVGLELCKGCFENFARTFTPERLDQVDRHVVGRSERADQRVGSLTREAGYVRRVHVCRPLNHRVTLGVDSTTTSTAGKLGVLPRRNLNSSFAVVLIQSF